MGVGKRKAQLQKKGRRENLTIFFLSQNHSFNQGLAFYWRMLVCKKQRKEAGNKQTILNMLLIMVKRFVFKLAPSLYEALGVMSYV